MANMALIRLACVALAVSGALAAAPAAATTKAAVKTPEPVYPSEVENWSLMKALGFTWVVLAGGTTIYCAALFLVAYMRTVAALNNNTQRYFARPNFLHGDLKRHLFDAPLFRKRHHREFKLSRAIDMGTLPSRMQTFMLVGYIATMIGVTVVDIDWTLPKKTIYVLMYRRTGNLAVINMLPLFLLAGRNNPLLKLTGITFDTYNLIHRWLGRIVVAEVIVHAAMWMVGKVAKGKLNSYLGMVLITNIQQVAGLLLPSLSEVASSSTQA